MAVKIQLRGDTKARWESKNPVLAMREVVIETDTNRLKIGDSEKRYKELPYLGDSAGGGGGITVPNGTLLTGKNGKLSATGLAYAQNGEIQTLTGNGKKILHLDNSKMELHHDTIRIGKGSVADRDIKHLGIGFRHKDDIVSAYRVGAIHTMHYARGADDVIFGLNTTYTHVGRRQYGQGFPLPTKTIQTIIGKDATNVTLGDNTEQVLVGYKSPKIQIGGSDKATQSITIYRGGATTSVHNNDNRVFETTPTHTKIASNSAKSMTTGLGSTVWKGDEVHTKSNHYSVGLMDLSNGGSSIFRVYGGSNILANALMQIAPGNIKLGGGIIPTAEGMTNHREETIFNLSHNAKYFRLSMLNKIMMSYNGRPANANYPFWVGDSGINGVWHRGNKIWMDTHHFYLGKSSTHKNIEYNGVNGVLKLQATHTTVGKEGGTVNMVLGAMGSNAITRAVVQTDTGKTVYMTKAELKAWINS